jgi:hypothetical protein
VPRGILKGPRGKLKPSAWIPPLPPALADQLVVISREGRYMIPGERLEHAFHVGAKKTLCNCTIPEWAIYRNRHVQILKGEMHHVAFITTVMPTCANCRRLMPLDPSSSTS